MYLYHIFFFGYYLIILFLDRNKDYATGRATMGPTMVLAFFTSGCIQLITSSCLCLEVNGYLLLGVPLIFSFAINEYYFSWRGIGDEIVSIEPLFVNKIFTVLFSIFVTLVVILFFTWTTNFAQATLEDCL